MKWLKRLWRFIKGWFAPKPAPIRTVRVEDLPDDLEPRTLYLAGEGPHLWCAALLCPCDCGDSIQLNLLPQVRPCWSVTEHGDGTASLRPSVWRQRGCRSHFFVRRGRIEWCKAGDALQW